MIFSSSSSVAQPVPEPRQPEPEIDQSAVNESLSVESDTSVVMTDEETEDATADAKGDQSDESAGGGNMETTAEEMKQQDETDASQSRYDNTRVICAEGLRSPKVDS